MINQYQHLGTPLSSSEMKEISGGSVLGFRTKYECIIDGAPGTWVICYNGNPVPGCAVSCIQIGTCPAGMNECV